jgi:hypothetical protein
MKYELRTMRTEEVVAEFYAFFLSISINHFLIPHCNNSNTLSDSLSCSEVNWNKCGSELPTSQKTARMTGLQLISKVVIWEALTLSVRANFRHKTLLQHSLVSICLSVTGVWTVLPANYTCVFGKSRRFEGFIETWDTNSKLKTQLFARYFSVGYVYHTIG